MTTARTTDKKALPLPFVLTREQMVAYTHQYEGERVSDGRPKVPEAVLERMKAVTIEEAWAVLDEKGYHSQHQGNWTVTHENPLLVGRAVTCNFIHHRPDLGDVVDAAGKAQGLDGRDKHWVMDQLVENDVIVADLLDKQIGGGFFGDNLANMTGAVVWGGTRDLAGVLALEVVERSELTRLRDAFGFERLKAGVYTGGQIDAAWTEAISSDFHSWVQEKIDTLPPEQQEMLRRQPWWQE